MGVGILSGSGRPSEAGKLSSGDAPEELVKRER